MHVRHMVPRRLQPMVRSAYKRVGSLTQGLRLLPDVVVIGGQRCGTTSIFKALADHPQVLRPPVEKGVDYFTLHYGNGEGWYRSNFPLAAPARVRKAFRGGPVPFEACTYYMFHPVAMERIANDLPHIRLVAMLRDPVERAFSAYKHELARGFETEHDFMKALELEDSRLEGEVDKMRADISYESFAHRHQAYRLRGQYAEQLERIFSLFPSEQVHVLDSESFFAAPHEEYRRLTEFLGLRPFMPDRFDQHNARPSAPMPEDARRLLTDHYTAHDDNLESLLGRPPGWRRLAMDR